MLVIRRKITQKGNSFIVTIPKKEIISDSVIIMDEEAFESLIKKNGNKKED